MKKDTKTKILEVTLEIIDETQDIREVSLRKIARRLDIAHTSIYNYFDSLNDLYLKCVDVAIIKGGEYVKSKMDNSSQPLYTFFEAQFDFAIMHPGWYKFIWIANIAGKENKVYRTNIEEPRRIFVDVVFRPDDKLSEDSKYHLVDILHGYFHGDIVKYITGRLHIDDGDEAKKHILDNTMELYNMLYNKLSKEQNKNMISQEEK
ncbi:MAG: TetR/AcrR family transcriptional regulator [Fusobacteriota bacterium]